MQRQKERDHHWEDQIDVRFHLSLPSEIPLFGSRTRINLTRSRIIIGYSSTLHARMPHRGRHHLWTLMTRTPHPVETHGLCVCGLGAVAVF
jgi:hypothetical protein